MRGLQDQAGESLITAHPDDPTTVSVAPDGVDPSRRRRLIVLLGTVALVVYVADQLTKLWAVATLTDQPPRQLVGDLLRLSLIRNPGAAFSLGTGSTWLLTLVALVVLVVVIRYSRRIGSLGWAWAFGLLLGGAFGNLTDRLVRSPGVGRGHVVDFIDYNDWFIGNVADIGIVAAAVLIALLALRGTGIDGRPEGSRPEVGATSTPTLAGTPAETGAPEPDPAAGEPDTAGATGPSGDVTGPTGEPRSRADG